jgi:hypothetical protein
VIPQMFVFTASNPEARQHLVDSVQNPIDDSVVFGNFDEPHHEELERIKNEGSGFYAWGAMPGVRNIPTAKIKTLDPHAIMERRKPTPKTYARR